jgi:predicted lipid-binding transport protein (Tim44 family)
VETIYQAPPETTSAPVEDPTAVLARQDPSFNPETYLEARTDDFFRIQAAFMARDLTSVRDLLTTEMATHVDTDLAQLRANGKVNRLENITVRQTEIVEAWQELGQEYATVHFKANLLDYTVDDKTGEVLGGSKTQPVKFEEYWTFVRDIGFAAQAKQWRLSAIQQAE